MSKCVEEAYDGDFAKLWGGESRHYYVHGKDNIPFHTIVLPALLLAHGGGWKLPDKIISSEYLTLEGRRISTSHNWAIWIPDILRNYQPDSIRYFLITSGPEKRDSDFSWQEFVHSHNGELLGAYGNFVNRSLAFIHRYLGGIVPPGTIDEGLAKNIQELFKNTGILLEEGQLKEALDNIFAFVRQSNKYFDTEKPWETRRSDLNTCKNTLFNCVQIIANLAVLLNPFLPFSSEKIRNWLQINDQWEAKEIAAGFKIPEPTVLFERLAPEIVDNELEKLRRGVS